jgi:hypothetical protein
VTTTSSKTFARRTLAAALSGAAGLLIASVTYGQATPPASPAPGTAQRAPINPQSLSCSDLKAELKSAGELNILVGSGQGWGDTFYGPAVPRCQFYQMPVFAYVRARDGRCGIGYICVDKMSID